MLYPTTDELSKNTYNRYELAVAAAKCARILTDEYVRQRDRFEKITAANKELQDRIAVPPVDPRLRDEKAVQVAVEDMCAGDFEIIRPSEKPVEEPEEPVELVAEPAEPEEPIAE